MGEKEVFVSRRGLAKKHAALDYEVWQWKTTLEMNRGSRRVTKNEVQTYALEMYKLAGISNFKASDGWYRRWRQRWTNSGMDFNNSTKYDESKEPASAEEVNATSHIKKKRKTSEGFAPSLDNEIHSEEKDTTKNLICKDPQSSSYQEAIANDVASSSSDEKAGQISRNTSLKNVIPDESISGLDSFKVSVNIIKVNPTLETQNSTNILLDDTLNFESDSIGEVITSTIIPEQKILESNLSGTVDGDLAVEGQNNIDVGFKKVLFGRSGEQGKTKRKQDKCINEKGVEKTPIIFETNAGEKLWTVINQKEVEINLVADNSLGSQADSSLPTSSSSVETTTDLFILSSIFEQDEVSFTQNDHELFCDSCEDFHPRQQCTHSKCKQKKELIKSSLLNCVFENKESVSGTDMSFEKCETVTRTSSPDTAKPQLNNPSVTAPKGKRYLLQFKSQVITYALSYSVKQAAERFKVNRNTIAEWLAEHNRRSNPVKHVDQNVAGDSEFLTWLDNSKFNLTNELVKQKALEYLKINDGLGAAVSGSHNQSHWLLMYAQRLSGTENVAAKKRYIMYPEAFKRAVVFHAQTHSNMAASRVFGVARKRIIEWQQGLANGAHLESDVSKPSNVNNVTDGLVDLEVYKWFCQQQITPNSQQVRRKALQLYRAAGHQGIQCGANWYYRWRARHKLPASRDQLCASVIPLLIWTLAQLDNNKCVSQSALAAQAASLRQKKVSRGWTFRFCKKYSSLLQSLPDPETPLPSALEQFNCDFKQKLHQVISSHKLADDCIIALDEIPLHFLPKDKTKKPPLVRCPGFESCQATLMISCQADGTLLPTLFVFKGEGPGPSSPTNPHVIGTVNCNGQVSDQVMQEWLSSVCFKSLTGEGVLIMDSFDHHVTPAVHKSVESRDINVAITPAGCAFKLLPVTQFCHTFKAMLEDMCQVWLSSQTAALESPSPDQLYLWAVRAHKHIAKHCKNKIKEAFKSMLQLESEPDETIK